MHWSDEHDLTCPYCGATFKEEDVWDIVTCDCGATWWPDEDEDGDATGEWEPPK